MRGNGLGNQCLMAGQGGTHGRSVRLPQGCRTLDVGDQEGDHAMREAMCVPSGPIRSSRQAPCVRPATHRSQPNATPARSRPACSRTPTAATPRRPHPTTAALSRPTSSNSHPRGDGQHCLPIRQHDLDLHVAPSRHASLHATESDQPHQPVQDRQADRRRPTRHAGNILGSRTR
jgi:hypothetical protein